MARRGYGDLIAKARGAMTPEALGERIGQSGTTVRRIEKEETEPSVDQINALVSALPISAEQLLAGMGVRLSLPLAARVPRQLLEQAVDLDGEHMESLVLTATA